MHHLRKRVFVDGQVQGALLRRVALHWLAFGVSLAVLLFAIQFFQDPLAGAAEHLSLFPQRHGLTFVILLVMLPAFLWDTARLSHRFSGPILRLRRMMKELAGGEDPGELRFRDHDFWRELGEHFNGIRARALQSREAGDFSAKLAEQDLTYVAADKD